MLLKGRTMRLCKHCSHWNRDLRVPLCNYIYKDNIDVVTGEQQIAECHDSRKSSRLCGKNARYYA